VRILAFAALALLVLVGRAAAFPYGTQFDADPVQGVGGGGRVFVGAARDTGHTCAVCHADAPGRIGVHLEASPVELFAGYQPGARYLLKVVLADEWAGLPWAANGNDCGDLDAKPWRPCNDNGFALQIDDAKGEPAGALGSDGCGAPSAADADVRVLADGTAITHAGNLHDRVSWSFCWTAPTDARGALLLHVAAVDGSGGDGTSDNPNDPFDDDVFAASLPLPQAGAPASAAGCSVSGGARGGAAALLLALVALGLRARRRGLAALVVFLAAVASGCTSANGRAFTPVRPWQKEKLAKRIMLVRPDADEDRLDLHMLESREGSEGGFGTSGGGCGCN
jgi:MYXO-CTERM domain-containing protein